MINQLRVQQLKAEIAGCEKQLDLLRVKIKDLRQRQEELKELKRDSNDASISFYNRIESERSAVLFAATATDIRIAQSYENSMNELLGGSEYCRANNAFCDIDERLKYEICKHGDAFRDCERSAYNLSLHIADLQAQLRRAMFDW
ncbi:MAG: hypothetical protein LBG97_04985 [Coriobacteriales bacterium]|jgi:hypothetical protein|nr:hypothetical protein [Coriobacteriales bacterium]